MQPGFDLGANCIDIFEACDFVALKIDKKQVLRRVIAEPLVKLQSENRRAEPHRYVKENPLVHETQPWAYDRSESHLGNDVALNIDTRRHLGQYKAIGRKREDTPLGNVQDRLSTPRRILAAERAMFNGFDELLASPFAQYLQFPVLNCHVEMARVEGA